MEYFYEMNEFNEIWLQKLWLTSYLPQSTTYISNEIKFILPYEEFTRTLFISKPQVLKKNVFLQTLFL